MDRDGEAAITTLKEHAASMAAHLDAVVSSVSSRITQLSDQALIPVQNQNKLVRENVEVYESNVALLRQVWTECDELDAEFEKIRQLSTVVKNLKERVHALEQQLR
ncbi:hypothetical protein G7K_1998-t1 [Saitoella complicata NRRL Y-17804]|uniref:Biogenesis of lysosome-related organelles complex 1 subunit CNL1 n=1 Tax=Saitoella complicata (strain BCRC 22490 / CBS 7301 / JCM 7358 / NBRC 10748 / NRRL Y-17804) TaxID=698492 RepID=A0A0E9NEG2_SAICN|nr:hypothetical protein G7K_1998-t1 [Saitoella complicata NRRL Y-17804]